MSGLFNMLFGRHPAWRELLAMLNLMEGDCGRFRDCFPSPDGEHIIVYTRNGGGNRLAFQGVLRLLAKHPQWVGDADDDFDSTYCSITFKTPPACLAAVKLLASQSDTTAPAEKWKQMLAALEAGKNTPETKRALKVGEAILGAVVQNQGETTIKNEDGSVMLKEIKPKKPPES